MRSYFTAALLLRLIVSGCEITSSDDRVISDGFEISTIGTLHPDDWGSGVFYRASEPVLPRDISLEDVKVLLRTAINQGAPVEAAWFTGFKAECCSPSSNICTTAIVPPQLVVRLKRPVEVLALRGFTHSDAPMISCPNYVHKLVPVTS